MTAPAEILAEFECEEDRLGGLGKIGFDGIPQIVQRIADRRGVTYEEVRESLVAAWAMQGGG